MKGKICLLIICGAVLGGCVPSLHPLYTDKDVVYDPKLIGAWGDPNKSDWGKWEFLPAEPNNYTMIFTDKDNKIGSFTVHLVKIDKMLFLDIYPNDPNMPQNGFYQIHLLPVHTFMKIDQIEPTLRLRFMEIEKLEKKLKKERALVKHEIVDDKIVLTASTKELQKFMQKYSGEEWLFCEPSNMKRLLPSDPNIK